MTTSRVVLNLLAFALLSTFAVGRAEYVLVNNNNSIANSVILYRLNNTNGRLKKMSVLKTGGLGVGAVGGDFSGAQEIASVDANCLFALNTGSSDVTAFSKDTTSYKRVGNYFDQNLITGAEGDSVALTPNGGFLYASYTRTGNLGAWKVHSDCSLTLITVSPSFSGVGPLQVTPNGKYLLARGLGGVIPFGIDKATGNLTELGAATFTDGACARQNACIPYGIQITNDSKLAVFASFAPDVRRQHMIPIALSAQLTAKGLVNPKVRNLAPENNLRLNIFPFLSAAAYKGNGPIYLGVTSGNGQYSPGVLTADFTEKPVKFAVTSSTVANPEVGNIAVTGSLMVVAQYPNQIGVFRIKKDGSLKLLSTTTIDEQGEGLFSLSIFPNTR
jgi:hypothetical protein